MVAAKPEFAIFLRILHITQYIFHSMLPRVEIPMAIPMIFGSGMPMELVALR